MKKICIAKCCDGRPCKREALFGEYCTVHFRMNMNICKEEEE